MKKLFLIIALVAFVSTFAVPSVMATTIAPVAQQDTSKCKKDDKKGCDKSKKEACCKKSEEKACCKKDTDAKKPAAK